jgi:hypothetical protein
VCCGGSSILLGTPNFAEIHPNHPQTFGVGSSFFVAAPKLKSNFISPKRLLVS